MSHDGYWVRREQKKFQANSWDTLCQWAREGRLKLTDEYKTPESPQWRLVQRDPMLSSMIPEREQLILKRGDATYRAPNYELIQEWAKKGQVSPDDMVYSNYTQLWTAVSEIEAIMQCIPQLVITKLEQKKARRKNLEFALDDHQQTEVSVKVVQEVDLDSEEQQTEEQQTEEQQTEEQQTDAIIPILKPSSAIIQEICAPIYDVARLFLVIKDLRPLDRIKGECLLKSLKLDCQGMSKKEAFSEAILALKKHQELYLSNELSARSLGADEVFQTLMSFIESIEQEQDVIGNLDEERFVVGNQNRPKMTPDEASLMIKLQTIVEQMIQAVRAFKQ